MWMDDIGVNLAKKEGLIDKLPEDKIPHLAKVFPRYIVSVIVAATLSVAYAILTESALSYLGLGVRPPTPSWGNMLSSARSYLWTAPHLALFPGLLILLTVLAYNSLGDGLRDTLSS
jgi:peptide/nickel transport system permease protein